MNERSSKPEIKDAQKDYFRACFLAVFVAVAGFVKPAAEMSRGLACFLAAALLAAVGAYFHFWKRLELEIVLPQPNSRLLRMAVLWYCLSVVLGAALVRDPIKGLVETQDGGAATLEWMLAVAGASVMALALFRLFRLIWERVRR